ncbi:hypothetical protein CAPTEDRAFT_204357 [Capitella teleta]|uniref:Uncharacterized protein n=1 Tax=Capitella teleta TaxID=283909 RepID=R7TXV6_CAPTE|nr:hypothetical protein CAPTEDRAFT_204357 [Capitella teleta]|eukprot:ELT98748.1 hypothetical protein CAPTEDRAFT_204357 [Capitella teleta]
MAANPVVFIQGVRREVDLCVNILLAGGAAADNSNVIPRLESLERNLVRANGSLLPANIADALLMNIQTLLREARLQRRPVAPDSTGYAASRVPDGASHAPRYNITREQLEFLVNLRFTTPQMTSILQVSSLVVKRRLREWDLQHKKQYSTMPDNELDSSVSAAIGQNSNLGSNSIRARLYISKR